MKIILIPKLHKKPISLNLETLVVVGLLCIFLVAFTAYQITIISVKKAEYLNVSLDSETPLNDVSFSASRNENHLNAYITQISELHTRLINLDRQTERIQDVMKRQLVGGKKLPRLIKKDRLKAQGGPFINDDLLAIAGYRRRDSGGNYERDAIYGTSCAAYFQTSN